MASIWDFLDAERGQDRTRALNQFLNSNLDYYLGPTGIPDKVRSLNTLLNPIDQASQAGADTVMAMDPNRSAEERKRAAIDALVGTIGAAAPTLVASRAGMPAVNAIAETLTGVGGGMRNATDGFYDAIPSEALYAGRSLAGGDMRGVLDAFAPSRPAQGLSADVNRLSQNIPRQITENNVLSAVDRLSAEDLAAAEPFTRTSGFAAPREGGGRSRDPALFSNFSSKKQTGVPPSEWTVSGRSLPTSVQPPRDMTAEQLKRQGFTDLTGFVADSTSGSEIIDSINGLQFPSSVMQQAGHAFGDNINDLGFMSEAGALTSKANAWGRMMDDGGRVAVTPMTMGTSGGDFSQHQAMNLVQAIRAAESQIDPNFVPLVGAAKNNNRLLPEGMGLLSSELPEYLASLKGGQRAAFVKALDTSPALAAGVPSVGAVRWATMDPNLIDQPALSSGYRVFEPDLADRELRDFFVYPENHGSYDAAIKRVGGNMTMGAPRPWTIQFPDEAYKKIMDSTPSGANMPMVSAMPKDLKSFQMNPKLSQTIDNQWVDANMMYDEILRKEGKEQADLYAIDAMMNRATLAGR